MGHLKRLACACLAFCVAATALTGGVRAQEDDAWRQLLQRDATFSFTDRSASLARAALADARSSSSRRAAAWVALGCAGAVADRAKAEQAALDAGDPERLGAIFCLGSLAAGGLPTLKAIAGKDDPAAGCAWLALLLAGDAEARRALEEQAADPRASNRKLAEELLLWRYDPGSSRECAPVRAWLSLRAEAARRFGLHSGETWSVRALRELVADTEWVGEVVVGAAPRVRAPGVKDYLLRGLLEQQGQARLESAVVVMPVELSQLVANGLWTPRDGGEWVLVLDAVAAHRKETLVPELLRAARRTALAPRAMELLAFGGDPDASFEAFEAAKMRSDAKQAVCAAIGAAGSAPALRRFDELRADPDPMVRAAWLVAAMRIGQVKPRTEVERALEDAADELHAPVVAALCRNARDSLCASMLEARLPSARGKEKRQIALALATEGRHSGRATVRELLAQDPPPAGRAGAELVVALRRGASSEDLQVFESLFPRGDDRALDLELAIALGQLASPTVVPVLREALWRGTHDISILAAGELAEVHGLHFLHDELASPPPDADEGDMRRLGFAIGTWGGIDAVERVSRLRRSNPGDPAVQGAVLGALAARTR